jgi:hypothetical protein
VPVYTPSDYGTDVPTSANDGSNFAAGTLHAVNDLLAFVAPLAGISGAGASLRDLQVAVAEQDTASTSDVGLGPGTLSIDVSASTVAVALWQFETKVAGTGNGGTVGLAVDSTPIGSPLLSVPNAVTAYAGDPIRGVRPFFLAAGTHTFEMTMKANAGGAGDHIYVKNAYLAVLALAFA